MDNSEVQKILDKGAIPFAKFNRGIHCNVLLSEEEVQALYDIVINCESAKEEGVDYDYSGAIDKVADIINNHPSVRDFDLGHTVCTKKMKRVKRLIRQ